MPSTKLHLYQDMKIRGMNVTHKATDCVHAACLQLSCLFVRASQMLVGLVKIVVRAESISLVFEPAEY